ncbi:MAG: electron transfer flavoprotein subunit alpha/FixB family protein [bacterium]
MKEIFVLIEHRQGEIQDVTFELLTGAADLASKIEGNITAVLLGSGIDSFIDELKGWAHKILVVEDEKLKDFNAEAYQKVLSSLIQEHKPFVTLIAQSGFGVDLAPSLAVELNYPITTDCYEIDSKDGKLIAYRQMYGGKVNATIEIADSPGTLLTIRASSFKPEKNDLTAEVEKAECPLKEDISYRKFLEYVEAAVGEVDITQANVVIGVGRGIKEQENIPLVEELADAIGGVIACSRPIVDAGWLPKDRQVGSSGKTVKPKLYLALGISGAFQHVAGMKGADTVVAVNKDDNAPIFGVADYGIVDDLLKVVPALTNRFKELKAD